MEWSGRGLDREHAFAFGQGIHECLGRVVAAAMEPEIVRTVLLRPGLTAVPPPDPRGTKPL